MSKRKYNAAEISEVVAILRSSGEVSPEKLAGMDMLVAMLGQFDNMSDGEIDAEVQKILSGLTT